VWRAGLALAAVLVLAGCREDVDQRLSVGPTGAVDVAVTMVVDDELWSMVPMESKLGDRLGRGPGADLLRAEVRRDGASVSPVDEPGRHGVRISARGLSVERADGLLRAIWRGASGAAASRGAGAGAGLASRGRLLEVSSAGRASGEALWRLRLAVPEVERDVVRVTTRVELPGRVVGEVGAAHGPGGGRSGRVVELDGPGVVEVTYAVPLPPSPRAVLLARAVRAGGVLGGVLLAGLGAARMARAVRRGRGVRRRCPGCGAVPRLRDAEYCGRCGARLGGGAE
jgi:hypothetical protein